MKRAFVVAVAAAALNVPVAGATIVPQIGIGGANVGMTPAAVKAKLGPPLRSASYKNDDGSTSQELYYKTFTVIIFKGEVAGVDTTSPKEKTASGVGVGTTETLLRRTIKGLVCKVSYGHRACTLGDASSKKSRITQFTIDQATKKVKRVAIRHGG
jgi:hypothetical protein